MPPGRKSPYVKTAGTEVEVDPDGKSVGIWQDGKLVSDTPAKINKNKKRKSNVMAGKGKIITTYLDDGTKVNMPKNINSDLITDERSEFRMGTALEMCKRVMEGGKISELCSKGNAHGFPSINTFFRWLADYPKFKELYEIAKLERGTYYHDKAISTAESAELKEEVPAKKLQVDTYKWAAEIANPKEFGSQKGVNLMIPVQIILDTGIEETETIIVDDGKGSNE